MADSDSPVRWGLPHRIAFRFFCCYWLLYALPDDGRVSIFASFPGGEIVVRPYLNLWHAICPWVAIHIFHLSGKAVTYFPTGSGDTTLGYVQNLLFVVFAAAAALVWSVLDRRRPNYRRLDAWVRLLVRYTLAFTLFSYGFAKVFPLQFQPARFLRLIEPYGEFSPMGVLWSFMGASQPYTIFSGVAEVLGGLLLLFRRTTSLGAMVSFAVLLNVAALNYFYDVPVKLYSTNLLLMAVFLIAPDARRLLNVLVRNRAAAPADLNPVRFERRWLRIGATVFWVLFVGYELFDQIHGGWGAYRQIYVKAHHPPIYGLYEIESGAPPKWSKVAVDFEQGMAVRTDDGKLLRYSTKYAGDYIAVNQSDHLKWSRPDPDHVLLEGKLESAAVNIRLRKIDTGAFLLLNRGFHWINENPLNR